MYEVKVLSSTFCKQTKQNESDISYTIMYKGEFENINQWAIVPEV